jgi:stage II sporulation protein D
MNKLAILLAFTFISILLPERFVEAAETVNYNDQVDVSIYKVPKGSLQLTGNFQLFNKETNKSQLLAPNTLLNFEKDSTGVKISTNSTTDHSISGFNIQEVTGVNKVAVMTNETPLRRGASPSYDVLYTFSTNESAQYNSSFTSSSGEIWFNVTANGKTGWILASDAEIQDVPSLSLTKVSNGSTYRGSISLNSSSTNVEVINFLDMEDYLKGVVPSEMPSSWHIEALKAQAIAARSYAAHETQLSSSTASQVYKGYSGETSRTNDAIKATEGLVVKYGGKAIQTYFYSTSGGKTANVGDVWNSSQSSFPYLISVVDSYENSPYSNWSQNYDSASILTTFGITDPSAVLYNLSLDKTGANGEVSSVTIQTSQGLKTIKGNESVIRGLFPIPNKGLLYSNWFDAIVNKTSSGFMIKTSTVDSNVSSLKGTQVMTSKGTILFDNDQPMVQTNSGQQTLIPESSVSSVVLNGKGYGHRIGMSQYGAKGYAEQGWKATEILQHYFQGTTISK